MTSVKEAWDSMLAKVEKKKKKIHFEIFRAKVVKVKVCLVECNKHCNVIVIFMI